MLPIFFKAWMCNTVLTFVFQSWGRDLDVNRSRVVDFLEELERFTHSLMSARNNMTGHITLADTEFGVMLDNMKSPAEYVAPGEWSMNYSPLPLQHSPIYHDISLSNDRQYTNQTLKSQKIPHALLLRESNGVSIVRIFVTHSKMASHCIVLTMWMWI